MTTTAATGLSELDIVQNPAIGAFLVWHFTLGYQENSTEAAPLPLAFLVLPLLLHRRTFDAVASTRKSSGLPMFAAKFDREREVLTELHGRALQLRPLSLQSIGLAETSRLVKVDYENAALHGYSIELLGIRKPSVPERLKGFASCAEKVGYWFSRLGISQIASTLRIDF